MLLEDLMEFTAGKNSTRIKEDDCDLYTQEDFEKDLHDMSNETIDGCIINLIRSKAAPLSIRSSKKCLTSNFLLCKFDISKLDPWYFCYLFNESKGMEQQINMLHQGSTVSVKKLTIKSVGELNVTLLDIDKQKLIGQLYCKSVKQQELLNKQAKNIVKLTKLVIAKIEEDYENGR